MYLTLGWRLYHSFVFFPSYLLLPLHFSEKGRTGSSCMWGRTHKAQRMHLGPSRELRAACGSPVPSIQVCSPLALVQGSCIQIQNGGMVCDKLSYSLHPSFQNCCRNTMGTAEITALVCFTCAASKGKPLKH